MHHPSVQLFPATRNDISAETCSEHLVSSFAESSEIVFQCSDMISKRVSFPAMWIVEYELRLLKMIKKPHGMAKSVSQSPKSLPI